MKSHKQFTYLNILIFNYKIKHKVRINTRETIHFDTCIRDP